MQCGMCGVVWNVLMWDGQSTFECEVECRRDVEWCAEMWWSDLM